MMTLNDIKRCIIEKDECQFAYSRDSYMMEILMKNGSIKSFKYDDKELMQEDITKLNENMEILYG